jgi:hypothetical protein
MHANIIIDDTTAQNMRSLVLKAHAACARHPDSDYLRARAARISAVVHRQRACTLDMRIVLLEWQRQCPGENVVTLTVEIDRLREEMRDELNVARTCEAASEGV